MMPFIAAIRQPRHRWRDAKSAMNGIMVLSCYNRLIDGGMERTRRCAKLHTPDAPVLMTAWRVRRSSTGSLLDRHRLAVQSRSPPSSSAHAAGALPLPDVLPC